LTALDIQTAGITIDIERAAIGPSVYSAEVLIEGFSVT
jgi:hypothetical protein